MSGQLSNLFYKKRWFGFVAFVVLVTMLMTGCQSQNSQISNSVCKQEEKCD